MEFQIPASKGQAGPSTRGNSSSWRRPFAVLASAILISLAFSGALALQDSTPSRVAGRHLGADQLYELTNVWTVHLKFAPDKWEAMEPKGGGNPFAGGPGGRPGGD